VSVLVCVPGEAVGKGRPRVAVRGGRPSLYTPAPTLAYESAVKAEAVASMQGRAVFAGPVELKLQIFMGIPASFPKKRREAASLGHIVPTKKPDMDNVVKIVCDAFNGAVWVDDTQVVDLHVTRRYAEEPCIVAIVTELDFSAKTDD
jgi:Holliday junction resolvase RusA-like endonuclease